MTTTDLPECPECPFQCTLTAIGKYQIPTRESLASFCSPLWAVFDVEIEAGGCRYQAILSPALHPYISTGRLRVGQGFVVENTTSLKSISPFGRNRCVCIIQRIGALHPFEDSADAIKAQLFSFMNRGLPLISEIVGNIGHISYSPIWSAHLFPRLIGRDCDQAPASQPPAKRYCTNRSPDIKGYIGMKTCLLQSQNSVRFQFFIVDHSGGEMSCKLAVAWDAAAWYWYPKLDVGAHVLIRSPELRQGKPYLRIKGVLPQEESSAVYSCPPFSIDRAGHVVTLNPVEGFPTAIEIKATAFHRLQFTVTTHETLRKWACIMGGQHMGLLDKEVKGHYDSQFIASLETPPEHPTAPSDLAAVGTSKFTRIVNLFGTVQHISPYQRERDNAGNFHAFQWMLLKQGNLAIPLKLYEANPTCQVSEGASVLLARVMIIVYPNPFCTDPSRFQSKFCAFHGDKCSPIVKDMLYRSQVVAVSGRATNVVVLDSSSSDEPTQGIQPEPLDPKSSTFKIYIPMKKSELDQCKDAFLRSNTAPRIPQEDIFDDMIYLPPFSWEYLPHENWFQSVSRVGCLHLDRFLLCRHAECPQSEEGGGTAVLNTVGDLLEKAKTLEWRESYIGTCAAKVKYLGRRRPEGEVREEPSQEELGLVVDRYVTLGIVDEFAPNGPPLEVEVDACVLSAAAMLAGVSEVSEVSEERTMCPKYAVLLDVVTAFFQGDTEWGSLTPCPHDDLDWRAFPTDELLTLQLELTREERGVAVRVRNFLVLP